MTAISRRPSNHDTTEIQEHKKTLKLNETQMRYIPNPSPATICDPTGHTSSWTRWMSCRRRACWRVGLPSGSSPAVAGRSRTCRPLRNLTTTYRWKTGGRNSLLFLSLKYKKLCLNSKQFETIHFFISPFFGVPELGFDKGRGV